MVAHRIALVAILLALGVRAHAQEVSTTPVETIAAPVTTIATKTKATENADIAGRIQSIFSEIEALKTVRVQVSAGVVTLRGTVQTAQDVKRAEAIASRVSGVVTIQNELTRDLNVSTNVSPALANFEQDIRGLVQALPLLGVAFAIGLVIAFLGYLLAS
ncbi:MAG: BON domain-containing protein, partial [Sphingomicrobium sp.]